MPAGETEQSPSAWTIDSLHQHLNDALRNLREWIDSHIKSTVRLIEEMDKRYEQRFAAQQEAIAEKDRASEERFKSVNEFRSTLSDQARDFMPKAEARQLVQANADKIATLEARLTEALATINSRLDRTAGAKAGIAAGWGVVVAAVGIVGVLLGGVVAVIIALN